MTETHVFENDFLVDEDGMPKVFEVDLVEEYGPGNYTLETVDEYGQVHAMFAVSTTGPCQLPEPQATRPKSGPGMFKQTFSNFHGTDTIVKKDGECLPNIVWLTFTVTVDDIVPTLRGGVFRMKN